MIFSYETYWINTLFIPIAVLVFMLVLLVSASCTFFRKIMKKRQTTADIFKILLCLIVVVFCSIPQIQALANGGALLFGEKEEDALVCTGVIQSVCEPGERFPSFKSNHRYGADLVIENRQYFAVSCEGFEEGDCVEIRYLPNSRFVLGIVAAEEKGEQQ